MCFIGYSKNSKGYRLIDLDTDQVITRRDVLFNESDPIAHSLTKHIDIHFHFIREAQENDLIDIMYSPTTEMVADLFTKPLPCGQFEKLRALMGMKQLTN